MAVIGLGAMGGPMARHVINAGWKVFGCDLDAANLQRFVDAGGNSCATPKQAALGVDVLLVTVGDSDAVDKVLFGENGAISTLPKGSAVWLASTVKPDYARNLAGRLATEDILLVDGPVSGGMSGAEAGQLTVLAGGPAQALAKVEPVMQACSANIYRVGDVGTGSMFKAVNQLLTAAHIALTAEALTLARRGGLDTDLLVDVIRQSAGNSYQFEKRAQRMAHGDHARHASIDLFRKDLDIALDVAGAMNLPLPLGAAVYQIFTMAAALGYGNDSDTRVISVYETFDKSTGSTVDQC